MNENQLLCNGSHYLLLNPPNPRHGLTVGSLYIILSLMGIPLTLLLLVILSTHKYKKIACFKLIYITTFADFVNLTNAGLISGLMSITQVTFCDNHLEWLYVYEQIYLGGWYFYCISFEVLSFNRMLSFVSERWSTLLFRGKRAWLWLIPMATYSTIGVFCGFAVYLPNEGILIDSESSIFHFANNLLKLGVVACCNVIMLYRINLLLKATTPNDKFTRARIKLSLQTFGIALLGDVTGCTYLTALHLPKNWIISRYSSVLGQVLWLLLHCMAR
ncbi:hypothetical protein QR680_016394 [Steinernema hermaphroditum]|uniref:Uncharacterized protein n=1 Tax=Steinernema hermaphroditum TaxID=289476 RepID=A0AA39LMK6_9BILA|nr:hypothetical protein QR680_016394 [Steinernema hermaphroditum]